jgi:hypothetical protein
MKKKSKEKITEPLLLLPHELEKWPKKYTTLSDKRVMVYILNLVRVSRFKLKERLSKKIGTSRYNLLYQAAQNVLKEIGQESTKVRAETWYQNIRIMQNELAKCVGISLADTEYTLFDLIKELTSRIPKDYIKSEEPGKLNKKKKPESKEIPRKSPTITIKKKIKLPPKIIIVE